MRKKILVIGLILTAIITILLIVVKETYNLSPEFNYISAKLDIRNGNCRIVNVGEHKISLKEKETEALASKYGFKNVYIDKVTSNELKGINNYSEVIEIYLTLRNGPNWKANYQNELDSIFMKTAPR